MSKTHRFTDNATGEPIEIVIAHIVSFRRDNFSECTSIKLTTGTEVGVMETESQVRDAIEAS